MPKRYRQLRVKDLSKVLTWWLEWDSNMRLSGWKAMTPPPRLDKILQISSSKMKTVYSDAPL